MPNQKWIDADKARYERYLRGQLGYDRVDELKKQGEKKRAARLQATEDAYHKKYETSGNADALVQPVKEPDILPSLQALQPDSVWRRIVVRAVGVGGENLGLLVAKEKDRTRIQQLAINLVEYRDGKMTSEDLDSRYVELFGKKTAMQDKMRVTVIANGLIDLIARADKDKSRG